MTSRNQTKPRPRSPSNNADDLGASGCDTVEFTKEVVEALLNEKIKGKEFDHKGEVNQMTVLIEKLRLCIKWFQEVEKGHIQEQETLRNNLESSQRKCTEIEVVMRNKEEELNAIIAELRMSDVSLQENLAKQESEKLDAIECHRREKEARDTAEKLESSLREELEKAEQEKLTSLNNMCKRFQEYDAVNILRSHSLQEQLNFSRTLQDEAVKQKEAFREAFRGELQQVREDRDKQLTHVQTLTAKLLKYKVVTEKNVALLESLITKIDALENECSSQGKRILKLQSQLTSANEKSKKDV